jgi:hypothetical protein
MTKEVNKLALPKKMKVKRPLRKPDHTSKRGIDYWWGPEWVRDLNGTICRIKPIKQTSGYALLYMVAKNGNLSYIQGSIQESFIDWHTKRYESDQIESLLLGIEPDSILLTDWEYEVEE